MSGALESNGKRPTWSSGPHKPPSPATAYHPHDLFGAAHYRSSMTPAPDNPLALITGGARRVGRAIALSLSHAGCDLIITYNRSGSQAQETASQIRAMQFPGRRSPTVELIPLELDDLACVEYLGARLASTLPRLDVLVHNASAYESQSLPELSSEHILSMYRINAAAPLLLTKHLAPLLTRSTLPGGGAVVAMADMHAMGRPRKQHAAYSMSKAALIEMVRTLARELAPAVRVNGLAPGVIAFPESGPESDPQMQRDYLSRVPLQRAGTPEDAAEVVRWLAMEARYVTGEIVRVDGGRWLA